MELVGLMKIVKINKSKGLAIGEALRYHLE